jgi:hypothetical protein
VTQVSDTSPTPEPGTTPEEQLVEEQARPEGEPVGADAGTPTAQTEGQVADPGSATKQELVEQAEQAGVPVDSSMTKAEIAEALNERMVTGTGINQPRQRFPWETDPRAAVQS